MLRKTLICLVSVTLVSCQYLGGQPSDQEETAAFRQALHDYNRTADDLATGLDDLLIVSGQVNVLVEGENHEALGEALQQQGEVIDGLEANAARLQELDDELRRAVDGQAIGFVSAFAFAATVAALARYANERFERANAAWEESGEHLANGDSVKYEESRQEVARNSLEVLDKTVGEVTNVLTKIPVQLPNVGLVRLKQQVNGSISSDAKVLSTTKECETDPESEGCKIGISQVVDDVGGVVTPTPSNAFLVSPGSVPVDLGTVDPGPHPEELTVDVDLMPIDTATPESVRDGEAPNNSTTNGTPNGATSGTSGDSDGDGNPDSTDNCPDVPNKLQIDSDGDGIGNECDETACPDEYPTDEDGCKPGESWDRDVVACTQDMCPTGSMYTYTKSCCCDCWDDKTLHNVHDPCRPGYLLFCTEAE